METIYYKSSAADYIDELKALQDQFAENFDIAQANWFYNQAIGLLTFSTEDSELNFKYFQVGSSRSVPISKFVQRTLWLGIFAFSCNIV